MANISGFGTRINLKASRTFPSGFTIRDFPDDQDPFDIPSIQVADKAMTSEGELLIWSKASPIEISISVIPDSDDDQSLAILLEANRVGKNKNSAGDKITATRILPDGSRTTLTGGAITDGTPATSTTSAGRKKTKTYKFVFENKTGD